MDLSGIEYIAIRRVVERGTAEIIEQSEDVLFIRDKVSGVNLLACEDDELAREVMERHRDRGITLLTTTSKPQLNTPWKPLASAAYQNAISTHILEKSRKRIQG